MRSAFASYFREYALCILPVRQSLNFPKAVVRYVDRRSSTCSSVIFQVQPSDHGVGVKRESAARCHEVPEVLGEIAGAVVDLPMRSVSPQGEPTER